MTKGEEQRETSSAGSELHPQPSSAAWGRKKG